MNGEPVSDIRQRQFSELSYFKGEERGINTCPTGVALHKTSAPLQDYSTLHCGGRKCCAAGEFSERFEVG